MSATTAIDRSSKKFSQSSEACFCLVSLSSLIKQNLEISKFTVGFHRRGYCGKLEYYIIRAQYLHIFNPRFCFWSQERALNVHRFSVILSTVLQTMFFLVLYLMGSWIPSSHSTSLMLSVYVRFLNFGAGHWESNTFSNIFCYNLPVCSIFYHLPHNLLN